MTNDQQTIQIIFCVILSLCGYFFLLRAFAAKTMPHLSTIHTAIVLLVLYMIAMGAFSLIVSSYAGTAMLFPALAALTICVFVAATASTMEGRWQDVSVLPALLLLGYLGILASATLFSRENGSSVVILLEFDALKQYTQYGDHAALSHLLLNVVMFMPLGILLPLAFPFSPTKLLDVLSTGLLLTTIVEGGQFLWQLGQVDVEDLAANIAGASIGYALYVMLTRWQNQRADDNRQPQGGS